VGSSFFGFSFIFFFPPSPFPPPLKDALFPRARFKQLRCPFMAPPGLLFPYNVGATDGSIPIHPLRRVLPFFSSTKVFGGLRFSLPKCVLPPSSSTCGLSYTKMTISRYAQQFPAVPLSDPHYQCPLFPPSFPCGPFELLILLSPPMRVETLRWVVVSPIFFPPPLTDFVVHKCVSLHTFSFGKDPPLLFFNKRSASEFFTSSPLSLRFLTSPWTCSPRAPPSCRSIPERFSKCLLSPPFWEITCALTDDFFLFADGKSRKLFF